MKHFITFIFCFSLFIYIKSDLLDKLEHVINDKNVIFDEIHTDVDNSLKDSLKDESKTKLINTTNQTIKDDSIISYQNNRVNKDDQQITSNISNTYNNSNNNHSIQISQNNIPINSQNLNMNINYNTNDNVANNYQMQAGATDYNQMNNSNQNNYNNGINSYENFKNQAEFNQNMNNPAIFSSNSLDNPINNQKNSVPYSQIAPQNIYSYSNFPTKNTPNNYQINNFMQNNGISHPYFKEININNNELPDENSDIIFDHLFIDMNGEKELPYMKSKWTFDQINNEFILPEEILKEDDITKIQRIYSILDTMDLNYDYSNKASNESINKLSLPNFVTPPILDGFESKLKQINKNDEKHFKENIKNIIIKNDGDNNMIHKENMIKSYFKIRAPPNFLY